MSAEVAIGGVKLIPEPEVTLRLNAMADAYRAIIAEANERAVMLTVSNALANEQLARQSKEIEELKKPKEGA